MRVRCSADWGFGFERMRHWARAVELRFSDGL